MGAVTLKHRSRRATQPRSRPRPLVRTITRWLALALAAAIAVGLTVLSFKHTQPQSQSCNPQDQLVTFIGDSYTSGAGTDSGKKHRFPALVSSELGVPTQVLGYNGSGYVARGPKPYNTTFPEAAKKVNPEARLVVVFGSRNDAATEDTTITPKQIRKSAEETIATIRERDPRATIVIVGPPWINNKPPDRIVKARTSVRTAADKAGVTFVDPIDEEWFGEEDQISDGKSELIADDHIHPTDEGHEYLARRFSQIVRPHLACTAAPSGSEGS